MNKIVCLGDGYAHGHLWPEWPQILQALLPDVEVEIISAIGAGPEFLVSELLTKDISNARVVFQWPLPQRFDKLLIDQSWDNIIKSDPVYDFNVYTSSSGRWWCSSGSSTPDVVEYHKKYVNFNQSVLRGQNYKKLVSAYLEQNNCVWHYTSNIEQDHFVRIANLADHRGNEVQPSPIIHFHFLVKKILPAIAVEVDEQRSKILQSRIESTQWMAYDPDREEIWNAIKSI